MAVSVVAVSLIIKISIFLSRLPPPIPLKTSLKMCLSSHRPKGFSNEKLELKELSTMLALCLSVCLSFSCAQIHFVSRKVKTSI